MNSTKTRLYFICGQDRSVIVRIDLKSIDFKMREIKFHQGKIIDFEIMHNGSLVVLNKDGWVEIRDLNKKDYYPPTFKYGQKNNDQDVHDEEHDEEHDEKEVKPKQHDINAKDNLDHQVNYREDIVFRIGHGNNIKDEKNPKSTKTNKEGR